MIRLILSILGPVLFVANYWVCEWLYPHPESSWDIFIPMDMLSHNFWAFILFDYALMNCFEHKYKVEWYFIYLAACFSFFDISARVSGMVSFDPKWYVFSLLVSLILSSVFYGIKAKSNS